MSPLACAFGKAATGRRTPNYGLGVAVGAGVCVSRGRV
jgi:hypothetical protein